MQRDIEQDLLNWQQRENRLPLLLRGARQVGKSYIIEKFGRTHFRQMLTVNFELHPELIPCFNTLEPAEILKNLTLLTRQSIKPGEDLLFLDEIQDCPNAIRSMRYFKEKLPGLHVIGAGSLLEFTLNDSQFRMPVGRIESLYLKPLSFGEYLTAAGYKDLRSYLQQITLPATIPDHLHQQLLKLVQEYIILGGMPAVLNDYLISGDIHQCQITQTALLNTYRLDFGKYASHAGHKYLQRLFEKAPGLIAEQFKYSKVDGDMRSRDIKTALALLQNAGLIYPIYATTASGLPLISLINEKKFKLLFLDVGLVMRATRLEAALLLNEDILLVNRGKIAEQFVGQELLAYAPRTEEASVYFWNREKRSSTAEIDFVTTVNGQIIPIEVKAATTGKLKSLRLFMQEKNIPIGVRISQHPFGFYDGILSLPLYMISEMDRILLAMNLH